jgi:hypothetical protein
MTSTIINVVYITSLIFLIIEKTTQLKRWHERKEGTVMKQVVPLVMKERQHKRG